MYYGITSGRVLNGELLYTKILEVNLFAFAYRRFIEIYLQSMGHVAFVLILFPALCVYCINLSRVSEWVVLIFLVLFFVVLIFLITGRPKGVHPDSKPGRSRLSLSTSKAFMAFDLYSSKVLYNVICFDNNE